MRPRPGPIRKLLGMAALQVQDSYADDGIPLGRFRQRGWGERGPRAAPLLAGLVQQGSDALRGGHAEALLDQVSQLVPVRLVAEVSANPALGTNVRRHEEALGVSLDEGNLEPR